MSALTLFLISLPFRILNALSTRTFFQPDEYWQSLEIAHRLVFGYGYQSWEWRIGVGGGGIRSPLYPLLFVPVYWLLKVTGLHEGEGLVIVPKLVQAVIAASTDVLTALLATRLFGPSVTKAAFACSLISFFNAHAATRTFSNSTETALTAAALVWWPWDGLQDSLPASTDSKDHSKASSTPAKSNLAFALSLAALAGILRPSNVIIWIVLGLNLLWTSNNTGKLKVLSTTLIIGTAAAMFCFIIDTLFYHRPTFTPFTFLHLNVIRSISLFYGANPFHFYITQALPFMTLTLLPFTIHGFFLASEGRKSRLARWIVFATVGVYSLLGHKEFRFVFPLLPIVLVFSAKSLVKLYHKSIRTTSSSTPTSFLNLSIRTPPLIFISMSLLPAIYLSSFHCVGQVSILSFLRSLPPSEVQSVGFLMPCHSTPWMSHLHSSPLGGLGESGSGEGGKAWFITCEPPILGQDAATYQDQSDYFYLSPSRYLLDRFPPSVDPSFPPSPFPTTYTSSSPSNDLGWKHTWPSHIVVFQALLEEVGVKEVLDERGYRERKRVWNSHWHEDERRRGDLVVLRWMGKG